VLRPAVRGLVLLVVCVCLSLFAPSRAAAEDDAQAVFAMAADSILQIRVVETSSGAKALIGSGFFVGPAGRVVTNYHVVSKLAHDPGRYRIECARHDGTTFAATIDAIDVVHDLALLRSGQTGAPALPLVETALRQGARLYSLGHPHDLGLTIVEGTFNGRLDHSLYDKIHFTGSINPGMSGGPALTAGGEVAGVNVRTAGNQVSFLVPVDRVRALLEVVSAPAFAPPADFLPEIRRQLLANQDAYFAALLAAPLPTSEIAPFTLPGRIAPFVRCWADAERGDGLAHESVDHTCSTDDYVFIGSDQVSGILEYQHHVVTSQKLNRFQFFQLYSDLFAEPYGAFTSSEDEVTPFRCESSLVHHDATELKAVTCLRAYKKLPDLYDFVLRAAVVGRPDAGVESSLALSGVTVENAKRLARRYLEAISWAR